MTSEKFTLIFTFREYGTKPYQLLVCDGVGAIRRKLRYKTVAGAAREAHGWEAEGSVVKWDTLPREQR